MWKKIEAVLRPYKIQEIIDLLQEKDIFFYLEDCKGFGKRLSPLTLYQRKETPTVESLPRTKITLFVNEQESEWALSLILDKGDTGIVGDGKIFVASVSQGLDIDTREIYE